MKWILWLILMILGSFIIACICEILHITQISSSLGLLYGFVLTSIFISL